MHVLKVSALAAVFAVLLQTCAPPPEPPPADASAQLAALLGEAEEHALERDLELRLLLGLPVERLWDLTYEGAQEEARFARDLADRLVRIHAAALGDEELLTLEILLWQAEVTIEEPEHFWLMNTLTPYTSSQRHLRNLFAALPVSNASERDRYLALAAQVPAFVANLEERERGRRERGIALSRHVLPGTLDLLAAADRPLEESLYDVVPERLGEVDEVTAADFHRRLAAVVEDGIRPAWRRLAEWVVLEDYQGASPEGVGLGQYPGGEAAYRFLVKKYVTAEVSPEEVRRIGLEAIERIEAEMADIRREIGFEGTRLEFHEYLKSDPRFYPKSADEVAERLTAPVERVAARFDELFLVGPEAPWAVERLPSSLEGSLTFGYYDPPNQVEPRGRYYYNGSHLDQRSWIQLESLAMHELLPGHHYQVVRQMRDESLPALRRNLFFVAFSEGWASYAARLGIEHGIITDPYSRYGALCGEAFLATRLVVDTGMNAFGWTLEEARDFMLEHTLESPAQIETETLRYGPDRPGQALGYQMGKRAILELRTKAEAALGDRFDLRRFHEAVVGHGAMPLAVLEKNVDRFIERESPAMNRRAKNGAG